MKHASTSQSRSESAPRRAPGRRLGTWAALLALVAFVLAACQTAAPPPSGLSAGSPSFDGFGNTVVTGNVLADASAEATGAVVETVSASGGGTVSISANGDFTYLPAAGSTGSVTFGFTVTDGTDTADGTATLNLAGLVWYVDNAVAPGGSGTSNEPFDTIAAGVSAAASGDFVFVRTGSGGYSADVALPSGVSLIGAGTDLVVGGSTAVAASTAPTINAGGGVSGAFVTVASNNTVAGFTFDGSTTTDVVGIEEPTGTVNTGITISNNTFTGFTLNELSGDTVERAVLIDRADGFTFSGNTVTSIDDATTLTTSNAAIDLINVGGDVDISSNAFTGDIGTRLVFLATNAATALTVDNNNFSPTNHPANRDGFFVSTNQLDDVAASYTGNTFANIGFISLRLDVNGNLTAEMDVVVSGNTFNTAYIGVNLDADFNNKLVGLIENNTFDNTKAESVLIDIDQDSGNTVLDATVRNNTFNNVGVNNSAPAISAEMLGTTATSQTMRVLVDSNVVNGAGGAGLSVSSNGGANTNVMSVTAVNNDFLATNSIIGNDSVAFSANGSSTLCVDADTNEVTEDVGLTNDPGSFLLAANDSSSFDVETGNTDQANIASDFIALQVNGSASITGTGTVTEVADGTCAQPVAPVVP